MNSKPVIFTIILVGMVLLFALTNPKKDDHISEVKTLLTKTMSKNLESLDSTSDSSGWEILGSTLGLALGNKFIETFISSAISVDNYVLFSLTRIEFDGNERVIGYGVLGNVSIFKEITDYFNQMERTNK